MSTDCFTTLRRDLDTIIVELTAAQEARLIEFSHLKRQLAQAKRARAELEASEPPPVAAREAPALRPSATGDQIEQLASAILRDNPGGIPGDDFKELLYGRLGALNIDRKGAALMLKRFLGTAAVEQSPPGVYRLATLTAGAANKGTP